MLTRAEINKRKKAGMSDEMRNWYDNSYPDDYWGDPNAPDAPDYPNVPEEVCFLIFFHEIFNKQKIDFS